MSFDLAESKEIFKEYDIRGIYPSQINEELAEEIAEVLAEKIFIKGKVVVGHDTRHSSPSLYKITTQTLRKYKNLEIIEAGMVTTPMLHFLVNHLGACGGIIITASHNPKEYNGIKVLNGKMIPVGGKDILKLLA
jgi:phosphomannomutase